MSSIRMCLNSVLHHSKLSHHLVFPSYIGCHRNYSSFTKPSSSRDHHNLLLINNHHGKRIILSSRSISTTLTLFSSPNHSNTTTSFQDVTSSDPSVIDLSSFVVPEPPSVPTPAIDDLQDVLTSSLPDMAELPLSYLGLASDWTPVGWVMHYLDLLHSQLPWWGAIAVATLTFRTLIFPLVIKAQKNGALIAAAMPEIQACQLKMQNARISGDAYEVARLSQEMQKIMAKHKISLPKQFVVPLAQAPIFVSFFILLRRMSNLPVESLKAGGILWFTDLTVPDPYFILPVVTCLSLWCALEFGVEAGNMPGMSALARKVMVRGMPLVLFPFIFSFPSALLTYWCTTNMISVVQVFILKIPSVRRTFNLPSMKKLNTSSQDLDPKGFVQGFNDSWATSKLIKEMAERQRLDEINMRKGIKPMSKIGDNNCQQPKIRSKEFKE